MTEYGSEAFSSPALWSYKINGFTPLSKYPNSVELYLQNNVIQYVPDALKSSTVLPDIVYLNLQGNKITFLEQLNSFSNITSLETVISRTNDGLALTANSDSPQLSTNPALEEMYRKMKMLSRISSRFPDRCCLPGDVYSIYFITALDLSLFVLCDTTYPKVLAFSFLSDLQKEFLQFYDKRKVMAVERPYALIEFDYPLQKLKQRYNNPRTLNTKVNLQTLSEELRLRPPYVLCDEELRPNYGRQESTHKLHSAITQNRYLPLQLLGGISLALNCFCAVLNLTRGIHVLNESHSHIDETFDSDHYQTGATFLVCFFLSLYQIYLMVYPLRRRKPLACATLGSICICQLYLWEQRSNVGLMFHVTVACYGTFVIMTRQVQGKLPQYTL